VYVAALRKLALRHKGISVKYREDGAVKEHTDHRSELYGPQMRFGEHLKRRHEVTNVCSRFVAGIKGAKYFMLQNIFKNTNISKKLKLRLKNTTLDKTLTCASETWILTKRDRKQMDIFEGKCIEEF